MIYDELKTAFRVYDDINKQDRFLKENTASAFMLIAYKDAILPFEFRIPGSEPVSISKWQIMNLDGTVAVDLTSQTSLIEARQTSDYNYFIYKGGPLGITIPEGCYYLKFELAKPDLNFSVLPLSPNNTGTGASVLMTDEAELYYRATPDADKQTSLYGRPYTSESGVEYVYSLWVRNPGTVSLNIKIYSLANHDASFKIYTLQPGVWTLIKTNSFTTSGDDFLIVSYTEVAAAGIPLDYKNGLISSVQGGGMFSEVFCITCDSPNWGESSKYLKLEWDNDCDLGPIVYQTGFKNIVLLDTTIDKEEPTIEEDGFEDGFGNFFPTRQRFVDNLQFADVLPYYLAESIILMAMHKDVTVTMPFATYSGKMLNIKPTMALHEGTNLYDVTVKFQQETEYFKTDCCKNLVLI